MKEYLPLLGRMGISLVFILPGFEKCLDFNHATEMLNDLGLPAAPLLVVISIIVEFIGGILVLIGYHVKTVAVVMSFYLMLITALIHPIWSDLVHFQDFVENIAITGGLLTLAYYGGGPKSLDSKEL